MKKFFCLLLAFVLMMTLVACAEADNVASAGHSPSRSVRGTYTATLETPSGISEVNWSSDTTRAEMYSSLELNGVCKLSIPTKGDESLDGDQLLKSIRITFRDKNGKEVSLPGTLELNHFRADGNTFTFVPNYFDEGEEVTVIAEFYYQADGIWAKLKSLAEPTVVRGYYSFTVGNDTGDRLAWDANSNTTDSADNDSAGNPLSSIIDSGKQLWGSITGSTEAGASIGDAFAGVEAWWSSLDAPEAIKDLEKNAQELWNNFQNTLAISSEIPERLAIEWGSTSQIDTTGSIIRESLIWDRGDPRINPNPEDDQWINYPLHVLPHGTIVLYAREPDLLEKYDFSGANITLRAIYDSEGTKLGTYSTETTDNFVAAQPSDPQNGTQSSTEELVDTYKSVSPICGIGETEASSDAFRFHLPTVEYYANFFNEKEGRKAFRFEDNIGNILVFEISFSGRIRESYAEEEGLPEGAYTTTQYFAVQVVDKDWWDEIYGDIVVPGDGNK